MTRQNETTEDARCRVAWKSMSLKQREAFLYWVLLDSGAPSLGLGMIRLQRKLHGVPTLD